MKLIRGSIQDVWLRVEYYLPELPAPQLEGVVVFYTVILTLYIMKSSGLTHVWVCAYQKVSQARSDSISSAPPLAIH